MAPTEGRSLGLNGGGAAAAVTPADSGDRRHKYLTGEKLKTAKQHYAQVCVTKTVISLYLYSIAQKHQKRRHYHYYTLSVG